jgi:hypothetical protein
VDDKYTLILMDVLAYFLILLNADLLEGGQTGVEAL